MNRALLTLAAGLLAAGCASTPPALARVSGRLVVMGTTDTHGWLLPDDYYTGRATNHGLARLVPQVDSVRAAHPGRTVLVESGDPLQGNPLDLVYSRLRPSETHPVAAAINFLRYDASAIGNHEFNSGSRTWTPWCGSRASPGFRRTRTVRGPRNTPTGPSPSWSGRWAARRCGWGSPQ